jgi:hypothetical protein
VALAGLASGDIDISTFGATIIDADPTGAKPAFIGALLSEFAQFTIYGKPAYTSVRDLARKTNGRQLAQRPGHPAARGLKSQRHGPRQGREVIFAQTTRAQLRGADHRAGRDCGASRSGSANPAATLPLDAVVKSGFASPFVKPSR